MNRIARRARRREILRFCRLSPRGHAMHWTLEAWANGPPNGELVIHSGEGYEITVPRSSAEVTKDRLGRVREFAVHGGYTHRTNDPFRFLPGNFPLDWSRAAFAGYAVCPQVSPGADAD